MLRPDPAASHAGWRRYVADHLLWLLVAAGLALRLAWFLGQGSRRPFLGEADNVATAFTRTGVLADAFHVGQGPTAHLSPLPPLIAGEVYRVIGWHSSAAETVLATWSLTLVFLSFYFLYRAFGEIDSPRPARLLAFAALCLVPLNYSLEVIWFRLWDGAPAVFLSSLFTWLLLRFDRREQVGFGALLGLAALAAVLFFVNPPAGLAGYVAAAVFLVRRVPRRRWPAIVAGAAVLLALVLTPWTLRNIAVMHKPIVLRDNLGLELALVNYQGAYDTRDPKAEFRRRWREIHPFASPQAYARMVAAGGEVAYADRLGREARAWIAANPGSFAYLTLRHVREIFFPPEWYWAFSGDKPGRGTLWKIAANDVISVLGLAGIAFALFRRVPRYGYIAVMTLVPLLPYFVLQPTLRYRYLSVGILVFIAADFVFRAWRARQASPAVSIAA